MSYLKKTAVAIMVLVLGASVYAQAEPVRSENELINAMNDTLVHDITIMNPFTFNRDMNPYSDRRVSITVSPSTAVITGGGYSAFILEDSTFSIKGSTETVFTDFASASSGSVINITNSSAAFSSVDFSTNSAFNGGVLYSSNSVYSVTFSTFRANVSSGSGGALYAEHYSTMTFKSIIAASNTAAGYGGFLFADRSSFSVTLSTFAGNEAANGGAVSVSTSEFVMSSLLFSSNTASADGGALYVDRGSFTLLDSSFTANDALNGAAAYFSEVSSGYIRNIYLTSNTAVNGGGFYADKTKEMLFQNVFFISNTVTQSGAAMYFSESTGNVVNGVAFGSNTASVNGGAVYADKSEASFSDVSAYGNRAGSGGVFYLQNSSMTFFNVGASGNTADISAGAVYIASSSAVFQNSEFSSNKAVTSGGALYIENESLLKMSSGKISKNTAALGAGVYVSGSSAEFNNVSFENNNASANGGAVYIDKSKVTVNGGSFTGNKASEGGAFYLTGDTSRKAELVLNATNSEIKFDSNKAHGTPNDIYLGENSKLTLNAKNYNITLNGGIKHAASTSTISISKTGAKDLVLGGTSVIECAFAVSQGGLVIADSAALTMGGLNVASGGVFSAVRNSEINFTDTLTVAAGGKLATESVKSFYAKNLDMYGNLSIGVDLKAGTADKITADNINLNSSLSTLSLGGNLGKGSGDFVILDAASALNGEFKVSSGTYGARTSWSVNKTANSMNLHVLSIGYEDITGLDYNQQQVANLIGKDYDAIYAADGSLWRDAVSPMDAMNMDDLQLTLSLLSGSFYADLFKAASLNGQKGALFGKIKSQEITNENSWIHGFGSLVNFKQDEYVLGDFEDTNWGINAGWDLYNRESLIGGLLIGYENHDIKQAEDTAAVNVFKAGLYGAWLLEAFELKGILSLGYQSYETERDLATLNKKVKAEFGGYGASFDVQAGYRIWMSHALSFKPFVEVGASGNINEEVEEEGGGYGLVIESQNYLRSNALLGVSFEGEHDFVSWFINAGAGYLLSGAQNEIEAAFAGADGKMKIKGSKEGDMTVNAACGVEVAVQSDISVYLNAGYTGADNYENMFGNLGIRYRLSY